ncbi:MAG: hypothetical protein HOW73_01750 [Polyangiaceae bacterium]|nr:hypothetical protein [Polyangiaceae bacterium]
MNLASWTGWIAAAVMLAAAFIPLTERIRRGRRAEVQSAPIQLHVVLGLVAAGVGFLHPLTALFALGSPEAIGGGVVGLGFGGLAFVVLLAHTGLGLKLRDPKLRKRAESRRKHLATAITILLAVSAHAAACLWGGG